MTRRPNRPVAAYENTGFLNSADARALRILSEFLEPDSRFDHYDVSDTIVFFGSSRILPPDKARRRLAEAQNTRTDVAAAEMAVRMSRYYDDARRLARRLTEWSKGLEGTERRFVVCTGGGPGIMEAANRGASEAKGLNVGLNIEIPAEQAVNRYISHHLSFAFHYFFMRKFWFMYLAKAMVIFPGGFGTFDELFEVLTLNQTGKLSKPVSIVLYGSDYWREVVNFEALARHGTIGEHDLKLFRYADSVDDAFDMITRDLVARHLKAPGGVL